MIIICIIVYVMKFVKEIDVLSKYISKKGLRNSETRINVLIEFLKASKHLTAEELYNIVQKKYSAIGIATIYRNLHLFCESGIAKEIRFDDGISRYEPLIGHEHHDHLICTHCGTFIEVCNEEIENLQKLLAKKHGFILKNHKMELYGLCPNCH